MKIQQRLFELLRKQSVTDGHTDARTDGQRENSIPPTNKVCGGYKDLRKVIFDALVKLGRGEGKVQEKPLQ